MKCISCQNEIQDGLLTCPVCGTIQSVNNGVAIPPAPGVQPVQPVPGVPVPPPPVQTVPGVAVPPAPGVQPVQQPTGAQPQALGTVSQRDAIAQGIQSGNLVNGMYTADEVINSKEHQNFVQEEKKGKKKKTIITCIILILLIAATIGGYLFYKAQYKTASKRIGAFFDVVQSEVNGVIKNDTTQKNNGDYTLNIKIDENDKQYGITAEGKFAYDLSRLIDVTANIKSLKYGEELIEKDPINLEFYLNDSKAYINFQNFYDKYIFTEYDGLTEYKHNIAQNDIIYTVLSKELVKSAKITMQSLTSVQKIDNSSISGGKANIVSISLNADQRKNAFKRAFEELENDVAFMEQYTKLTGKDKKEFTDDLDKMLKDMKFDADKTVTFELHTGIFKSEFIGLKIIISGSGDSEIYVVKPIANGYSIKETKGKDQVLDLRYTKTKGATSTTRTTSRALSGTVYDGKTAKNIDISLEIVSNVVVDVKEVKVKDSVNYMNLTQEDFGKMIEGLDKYPKIKSLISSTIESFMQQLLTQPTGCNGDDMNCMGDPMLNESETTTEETPTEETPTE